MVFLKGRNNSSKNIHLILISNLGVSKSVNTLPQKSLNYQFKKKQMQKIEEENKQIS
jgi:hypothetical protein